MDEQDAILIIPDITGYTDYVLKKNGVEGKLVIYNLLKEIALANSLKMKLFEVQGDALLYAILYSPKPTFSEILNQSVNMFLRFDKMLKSLDNVFDQKHNEVKAEKNLGLKVIVHYGRVTEMNVLGFDKLVGLSMIELHRLMKNKVPFSDYILITETAMEKVDKEGIIGQISNLEKKKIKEEFEPLGTIEYTAINMLKIYDKGFKISFL